MDTQHRLSLSKLSGIVLYEPEEMVITVRTGTLLQEIEVALSERKQCLAFEPADIAPLWNLPDGAATIGGTIGAAICGPRRFSAGAPRDHLLGFIGVNGKGERFKAGGKVVKNVTGYDLPKLASGSFGTLFIMTELTLRAVPRAEETICLCVEGLNTTEALATLRQMSASPLDPTALTFLSRDVAQRLNLSPLSQTLIRLEGQSAGVAARATDILNALPHPTRTLKGDDTKRLFSKIASVHPMFDAEQGLWRVSVPPTSADNVLSHFAPHAFIADWAGGLLWLQLSQAFSAREVHKYVQDQGGHATWVRQSPTKDSNDVFPLLDPNLAHLTSRLKDAFDPARILNPGRMYKDI
jgi:glycolate oxidase FAD binding subunit